LWASLREDSSFLAHHTGVDIEEYRRSLSADALAIGQETTMRMLRSGIAVIAGLDGVTLALVQTVAFGWALTRPELRGTTPDWMWACLIVLTFGGIVAGSTLRRMRMAKGPGPPESTAGASPV
jgi:hypothetical protein